MRTRRCPSFSVSLDGLPERLFGRLRRAPAFVPPGSYLHGGAVPRVFLPLLAGLFDPPFARPCGVRDAAPF